MNEQLEGYLMIDNKILIACIFGLAIALLPLPYAYYMLLRVAIFGISAYLAVAAFSSGRTGLAWALAINALVYNPVFPVHMTKDGWTIINLLTIGLLGYVYKINR